MSHVRRVLVVDDSQTTRAMLSAVIEDHPQLTVLGEARNGRDAVAFVERRRPDIVTMDVRMPGMDGIEATKQIMRSLPTPIVIVAGAARDAEVRASLEAMELGALAVLPKPRGPLAQEYESDCKTLQSTLVALADVRVVRRRERVGTPRNGQHTTKQRTTARAIGMAASTGGPCVLRTILAELPGDVAAPLLIVQHIAPGFIEGLAAWLDESTPLSVSVARDGEPLRGGHVYLAPDDFHMGVERGRVRLDDGPRIGRFRPAADFLFESMARMYGRHLFSVILSGMGSDGVAGLRAIQFAGGDAVAQDEASSVVYGMPREALEARVVRAALDPLEISAQIRRAVKAA